MLARCCVRGFSLLCLATALVGCSNQGLDSLQVTPATQSLAVGQTAQLTATGTYGNANHASTQNITGAVTWTSSTPSVATVSASGIVTAVSAGSTIITASAAGFAGPVTSTTDLTVTGSTGGTAGGSGGSILSLTIIPSGIVFGSLGDSGQLLAIGTFSTAPTVRDVTNLVTTTWLTSEPNKYPVTNYSITSPGPGTQNGGVVSVYEASVGNVGAVITAEATDTNGSIATATANVGCPLVLPVAPTPPTATSPGTPGTPGSCYQNVPQLLTTLTVYNEGLNITNWLVTAPSATCNPAVPATCTPVLTCGPAAGAGNSVCTATYPLGTTVTLTAPSETGVKFGGWSSNCFNIAPVTQNGPNSCTVNLSTTDATVGAIFN